jgi:hypothetical protein
MDLVGQVVADLPRHPPAGAWGQIFVSFDFTASNTNTILNNNQGSDNGDMPRFRDGYATLGGLLMGQSTGTFTDNDSLPELLDIANQTGINFAARTPQVRYTYPLPSGMSLAVAAENPNPFFAGPFGAFYTNTNQIPTAAACTALTSPTVGLRSTTDFSMNHNDILAFIQASGRGANNKELNLTHLDLTWSPVSFVDLGVEGAWGHRGPANGRNRRDLAIGGGVGERRFAPANQPFSGQPLKPAKRFLDRAPNGPFCPLAF